MKFRIDMLLQAWRRLRGNPHFRRLTSVGFFVLPLGFLLVLLFGEYEQLQQFDNWQAYLVACGKGFLLYPVALGLQALTWSMMIARLRGVSCDWHDIEIYAYTHLMRRLPSALWYLTGRAVMYQERGVGAGVALVGSGLEWLLLQVAAVFLYSALSLSKLVAWLPPLALLVLLVTSNLYGLRTLRLLRGWRRLPGPVRRWLGSLSEMTMPRGKDLALWIGLYAIAYGVGGLLLFLLVHSVESSARLTLVDATRTWALLSGVSFLASLIVPVGLGIRELTLTALLTSALPPAGALLVAVLVRVLFLVSDLVWGGGMWGIARISGRRRQGAGATAPDARS